MEHLMTSEEVAEVLHVDPVTIRRLVNKGELSAYRIGADYRFSPSDLQSYLKRQRVSAHAESGPEGIPGAQLSQLAQFLGKVLQGKQPPGSLDRFDRFTKRARNVLNFAQEEAQSFQHSYIGTEHLLLGLIREGGGVAAQVLNSLGADANRVRQAVEAIIGRGDHPVSGLVGLTPRSKKVIEYAVDEARRFDHHYIGTEHLLLGLLREKEGVAAHVLDSLSVNFEETHQAIIQVLNQHQQDEVSSTPPVPGEASRLLTEEEQGQSCSRCGARSPNYFRHCFHCGNPFPREETPHDEEA